MTVCDWKYIVLHRGQAPSEQETVAGGEGCLFNRKGNR